MGKYISILEWKAVQRLDTSYSVDRDLDIFVGDSAVGYISNLVWYYSFFPFTYMYIKVDYGKYRSGAEDYLITTPNIYPVSFLGYVR